MTASAAELWWPRRFAAWVLATGSLQRALLCIVVAMVFSTAGAYRVATTVRVESLVFGPDRSPVVDALLASIGVERTAVLVYMLERSFDLLVLASAFTPIFIWLLGSSAIHAAALIRGVHGHAYRPLLTLFGYAELVYQTPTSLAGLLFSGTGVAGIASLVSVVALGWFAFVAHRGIALHYEVSGDRAFAILAIGGVVFYLLPLVLIGTALVAIIVAAAVLEYF